MVDLGTFSDIIKDAVSDMPDKLNSAATGFKDLFGGFDSLVRRS